MNMTQILTNQNILAHPANMTVRILIAYFVIVVIIGFINHAQKSATKDSKFSQIQLA